MEKLIITFAILFSILACNSQKPVTKKTGEVMEFAASEDSTEYELIVFDPKYETFLLTQPHPKWFYSDEYYKSWNLRYAIEWNVRYSNPMKYGDFYECQIPYEPTTDYGLDFNFRLYQFFQFIEQEYGIVLIGRRGS